MTKTVKTAGKPAKSAEYGADSIRKLSDSAHVRKRVAMYLGSADNAGIFHAAREVYDNSLDEYQNGHAKTIEIILSKDGNTMTVRDDGRGMPVGKQKDGENALTVALTNLKAGGKFDEKSYKGGVIGLHGVGAKACNFTSEKFEVVVWRDGKCWTQRFQKGAPVSKVEELPKRLKERRHGTETTFTPDMTVFTEAAKDKPAYDAEQIRKWLSSSIHLCKGLTVHFTQGAVTKTYTSEKGGAGYVLQRAKRDGRTAMHKEPVQYEGKTLQFALLWVNTEDALTEWIGFANRAPTPEGGTHVQGLKRAIGKALSETSKRNKATTDDLADGLYALINVAVVEPKFKGQTKGALGNNEVEKAVFEEAYAFLRSYFAKGPGKSLARTLLERAVQLGKVREQSRKLRKAVQETTTTGGVLPPKLARATKCTVAQRELFIVEGDSAGGSAKKARDTRYQEVLPLRGKFLNAGKESLATLLGHVDVQNILKSIGVRINPKDPKNSDMSKVRVGKILLLMDADPDGRHIESLALVLIERYAPELVERGLVYIVRSPLFRATSPDGKQRWYGESLEEIAKKSKRDPAKLNVSRLKGHGEANANELKEYALSPLTRKLRKLESSKKEVAIVLRVMGEDAQARKELLGIQPIQESDEDLTSKSTNHKVKALPAPKTAAKATKPARKAA